MATRQMMGENGVPQAAGDLWRHRKGRACPLRGEADGGALILRIGSMQLAGRYGTRYYGDYRYALGSRLDDVGVAAPVDDRATERVIGASFGSNDDGFAAATCNQLNRSGKVCVSCEHRHLVRELVQ
jgi:hypothetical protein